MRVLTNLEMNEFELTYKFLDHNIGSFALQAPTVSSLRFDGRLPNPEIIDFVRRMGNLKEFPEFDFDAASFARLSPLRKVNAIFNNVSPARKRIVPIAMKFLPEVSFAYVLSESALVRGIAG